MYYLVWNKIWLKELYWLILYYRGKSISKGDEESDKDMKYNKVYNSKEKKPILASLLDLYSELEAISVSTSNPSSHPIPHCLLIT